MSDHPEVEARALQQVHTEEIEAGTTHEIAPHPSIYWGADHMQYHLPLL